MFENSVRNGKKLRIKRLVYFIGIDLGYKMKYLWTNQAVFGIFVFKQFQRYKVFCRCKVLENFLLLKCGILSLV